LSGIVELPPAIIGIVRASIRDKYKHYKSRALMNDTPRVLRLYIPPDRKIGLPSTIDPITFDRNDVRRIFCTRLFAIRSRANGE